MSGMEAFLAAAVVAGTPILFATLGEIMTEKVGNLNLGIEGMMLMGAVVGFICGFKTGSSSLALLAALAAGGAGALIYAFLTISLRANQVVSGLTLTIFGTGLSSFLGKGVMGQVTPDTIQQFFVKVELPLLSKIPFLGPIFFKQDPFVYLGYITAILLGLYLYKTPIGLNVRAIGENPGAADAASINVTLYKYIHVVLGGGLCGLGGAYLSLVYVPAWQDNITAGRGWIAVALVIFASWNPYKALIGAFLYGGLDIVGFRMQGTKLAVSQYLIDMLPYLVTIFVLILASMNKNRRKGAPKSLGNAYYREER
jgi:general nucleoside transport system permease protein